MQKYNTYFWEQTNASILPENFTFILVAWLVAIVVEMSNVTFVV